MGACAVLLFLIAATAYVFEIRKMSALRREIDIREQIAEERGLFVRNLRERIEFYKTPEGIAHLALSQHDLARPGERIFLIESVPLPPVR